MTTNRLQRVTEEQPSNSRECLLALLDQLQDKNLHQVLMIELKRMLHDHDRLVHMLQQRSELLENDNQDLRTALDTMQQRHEKAVREMQFFKKKYEKLSNDMTMNGAVPPTPTTTISTSHRSISNMSYGSEFSNESIYHHQGLPPPPPPPILEDYNPPTPLRQKPLITSRSTSTTLTHSNDGDLITRPRQNSSATTSIYSSTSDTQSVHSNGTKSMSEKQAKHQSNNSVGSGGSKSSWQQLRHPPSSPSATTTTTTTTTSSSSSSSNGPARSPMIQQRRVDPLTYGGADGLWDTIAKSKGSDVTVEKIISNFLRRGGSPNTAKQHPSSSSQVIKTGYGLIHALIVTKASSSLDVLLQHGANPNALALNTDDPVTPCTLAARLGWLSGLEKLVQAGGELTGAALHAAAEHCHTSLVEYIVQTTRGELNTYVDAQGATVLHYACASGHTDLVSYFARTCQIPVLQSDHHGELPLHWAARQGRLEVVTLLIERFGVDCNAYVPKKIGTPLDIAKSHNHRRLVDYLKGLGALSAKKMDKRREDELAKQVPGHFESTLAKHGLFGDTDGF